MRRQTVAYHHEDSESIEAAVGGETEATDEAEARVEQPHACEHCGRVMQYADQSCACLHRDPWKGR